MSSTTNRVVLASAFVLAGAVVAQAQARPEVVALEAPDGVMLKASYFPGSKPGPGILLLHQCNSDRSAWTSLAAKAAASGFHVLALDYRGFGESEGARFTNVQEQGPVIADKWPGDIDAAFDWLVARPGVDRQRIGAAGASCGVNQSAQLARRHPEVKTVVLLSGGINPDAREYIARSSWLPVLAAASLDDGNAVQQMRWLTGWSKSPASKFMEFKAAGHGTDMFAVEKGLEPAILDWFETHLRNASTTPPAQTAAPKPGPTEEFWGAVTAATSPARGRSTRRHGRQIQRRCCSRKTS